MRTSALFGAKNFGSSQVMMCLHKRGGKGSFVRNFVQKSFTDGSLKAMRPNVKYLFHKILKESGICTINVQCTILKI